jgi:hypothetical protein
MSNTEKDDVVYVRESGREWLAKPLTTGTAVALLGANIVVMLLLTLYLAHRLDLLETSVGSIIGAA